MSERRDPDADATGPFVPSPSEPRFAAGDVLAGRYRMAVPLGRGGMGEVWRADDLTLGTPVALKFLPAPLTDDADRLQRFRKEVALARRVSHPNCCRVYDLAEHDGQPFLTMELVEGEDLAALLRRVGRLPEEKAVEVARQLCAALAAVHEQGLLHRDLKPANVMLDGRGKVRLADFGLAAAAGEAAEARAGTPAYMAPEQRAGQWVSARSDVYALGLVLYELFTGHQAFAGADRATPPPKPSSHVSGLAPAVERVILRCLAAHPAERPGSAEEVLAGLPGGDLLAAALAAGETPSPQLVADAGGVGAIRPAVGLALVGAVVAGIVLVALLADRVMLFRKVPLPDPPEVMARRARQVLEHCGYPDAPADAFGYFCADGEYLGYVQREDPSPRRWDDVATVRPSPLYFFYRQSPRALGVTGVVEKWALLITDDNPPPFLPGMAGVHLDPNGKLLRLYTIPARQSEEPPTVGDPEWDRWFDPQTIGFDLTKDLQPAVPQWASPCACDRRAAWTGALPGRPDRPVRVEAAADRGRPVYFEVMPLWRKDEPADSAASGYGLLRTRVGFSLILAGAVLLAARNLRRGRGNPGGAARVGAAILTVTVVAWLLGGHHSLPVDPVQLDLVVGTGGWFALSYGLGYLALEPAVRRRWPWRLTAWGRLLAGRLRDPMVGRDVLIGLAAGVAGVLIPRAGWLSAEWAGVPPPPPLTGIEAVDVHVPGPPAPLLFLVIQPTGLLFVALVYLLLSFLFFLVLRREWLAWGAVWLIWVAPAAGKLLGPSSAGNALSVFGVGLMIGLSIFVLARFGLLALTSALCCWGLLSMVPLTADLSAWYAYQGEIVALVIVGLAIYGFLIATRGQRLFRAGFFGDE
jgi:serine/threonine-protein kinase